MVSRLSQRNPSTCLPDARGKSCRFSKDKKVAEGGVCRVPLRSHMFIPSFYESEHTQVQYFSGLKEGGHSSSRMLFKFILNFRIKLKNIQPFALWLAK